MIEKFILDGHESSLLCFFAETRQISPNENLLKGVRPFVKRVILCLCDAEEVDDETRETVIFMQSWAIERLELTSSLKKQGCPTCGRSVK